jgi:phosphoribosylformylglycinamidine cyclo-ligase
MEPTRIYVKPLLALMQAMPVKGMAHITGGGLVENVPRVLPDGTRAVLQASSWPRAPLFDWLQKEGGVDPDEMHRVFNCGIGMAIIVPADQAQAAQDLLSAQGEAVYRIGEIEAGSGRASASVV